jgi:hypothetical protein
LWSVIGGIRADVLGTIGLSNEKKGSDELPGLDESGVSGELRDLPWTKKPSKLISLM